MVTATQKFPGQTDPDRDSDDVDEAALREKGAASLRFSAWKHFLEALGCVVRFFMAEAGLSNASHNCEVAVEN